MQYCCPFSDFSWLMSAFSFHTQRMLMKLELCLLCWHHPRGLLWASHHPHVSVPFTASPPKTSWGRQRLGSWLLGWWENLQRTKAKGNTRPMTPTLTDLSCTPMTTTTKKMRMRTAVEKVRLFKREGGRRVHGGQKQSHSEKTKASSGTRHLMLSFSSSALLKLEMCIFWSVGVDDRPFWKMIPQGRGVRETVYEASMPIWTCLKCQTTEAFLRLVRDDPSTLGPFLNNEHQRGFSGLLMGGVWEFHSLLYCGLKWGVSQEWLIPFKN